jgi:hypothetical protein
MMSEDTAFLLTNIKCFKGSLDDGSGCPPTFSAACEMCAVKTSIFCWAERIPFEKGPDVPSHKYKQEPATPLLVLSHLGDHAEATIET